jgi:hypothetical protein
MLKRGCGVTQILRDTAGARDGMLESLEHARELRRVLQEAHDGPRRGTGVPIAPSDAARALRYLESRIDMLVRGRSVLVRDEPAGDTWTLYPPCGAGRPRGRAPASLQERAIRSRQTRAAQGTLARGGGKR